MSNSDTAMKEDAVKRKIRTLYALWQDGRISLEYAGRRAGMSQTEFLAAAASCLAEGEGAASSPSC